MSDLSRLEQRIAELEREIEILKTREELFAVGGDGDLTTSLGLEIGTVYAPAVGELVVGHTGDGLKIIKCTHDDLDTYPNAFGYLNASKDDPQSGTTGAFDHGAYWDANNFNFMVNYLGNIDFYIKVGGSGRYVMEMAYDFINLNVPIKVARLTTTERNALSAAQGMIIYNTTTGNFEGYNGTIWVTL